MKHTTMSSHDIDDCWNKIGVWRQEGTICPLLSKFIHCRNCDVFIDAGLSLLDRDIPENYTHDNTHIFKTNNLHKDIQHTSCLIFRLGAEWYAIKTSILVEICELTEIHSIPHNKQKVLHGLICINGEMEVCMSLSQLVLNDSPDNTDHKIKSRIVLVNLDSGKYAFKACEIAGIYPINMNEMQTPPASVSQAKQKITEFVFTYNNNTTGLIDEAHLNRAFFEAST